MKTFKALLDTLFEVSGVPFSELAPSVGVQWNEGGPVRNKGFAARVVQKAMGMSADDNRPEPDLTDLGIEIKSIPIGDDLKVLENTKICSLNFKDTHDSDWKNSKVYAKVRNILFVPVVKYDKENWKHWYIRAPFIWMPSLKADKILESDYRRVQELLRTGRFEEISSKAPPRGPCDVLIPNTAGENAEDITRFIAHGGEQESKRRAWFLRKDFTQEIIHENIAFSPE